jgi:putative nucleotidyltransferase with HDIG domain
MSLRILFVDDEPNVLSGLRRMLRPLRQEWSAEFAEGGAKALAAMEQAPFDVLVTDMRMPGMTGAELMEEVRRRHPHVVRILLSGQCDEASSLRALQVAHQMLSKPCGAEALKATVASACALRDLLADPALVSLVARKGSVPSLPALHAEVIREMGSADPWLDRVASLVAQDVGMSAKILQVANSSYFGGRTSVSSPKQAVTRLGLETMRALVLAVSVFSRFNVIGHGPLSLEALWTHSQAVGLLAGQIAKAEGTDARTAELAAVAGLLHDVGKLILLESLPDAYQDAFARAQAEGRPVWEVEREAFGASHDKVGACLLGLWGLPTPIVEGVAWHHRPSACPTPSFCPLTAVHAADALLRAGPRGAPPLDREYLERLNLLGRVACWQGLAAQHGEAGEVS